MGKSDEKVIVRVQAFGRWTYNQDVSMSAEQFEAFSLRWVKGAKGIEADIFDTCCQMQDLQVADNDIEIEEFRAKEPSHGR